MAYDFKKHSDYVWKCDKCGGYWGANQVDGNSDITCPACMKVFPALHKWRITIEMRAPVAIFPERFPMLYSAMIAFNGDTAASREPCLPASAFHGHLAFLTLDALRAMDGDLALFYRQYGAEVWEAFLTGEQNEVEAHLNTLPFSAWHRAGIWQTHALLNQWFNGFEDGGKTFGKSEST